MISRGRIQLPPTLAMLRRQKRQPLRLLILAFGTEFILIRQLRSQMTQDFQMVSTFQCLPQGNDIAQESESSYQMAEIQIRLFERRKRLNKIKKRKKMFNIGTWSLEQNLKYKEFLEKNAALFETDSMMRRIIKINLQISKVVESRTPDQCRSHHQKMMKYHKTLPQIIDYINSLASSQDERAVKIEPTKEMMLVVTPEMKPMDNDLPDFDMLTLIYEEQQAESKDFSQILDQIIWYDGQRIW